MPSPADVCHSSLLFPSWFQPPSAILIVFFRSRSGLGIAQYFGGTLCMSQLAHHHALQARHVALLGGDFKVSVDNPRSQSVSVTGFSPFTITFIS